jgi:hypothetical protein
MVESYETNWNEQKKINEGFEEHLEAVRRKIGLTR